MRETILQAVRSWVLLATSLPAIKVIPADDYGTRPALPYITVTLTAFDLPVGHDEQLLTTLAGKLRERVRGDRRAVVSLNAYGKAGADLLALCNASLAKTSVQGKLGEAKITLMPAGPSLDLSSLVDTRIEKRFVKDFEVVYAFETSQETIPHVETISLAVEIDADPDFGNPFLLTLEN